jgi:hypothetical protein
MTVGELPNVAEAVVGPFAADTLADGVVYELLIFVTTPGKSEVLRAPVVVLHDCG